MENKWRPGLKTVLVLGILGQDMNYTPVNRSVPLAEPTSPLEVPSRKLTPRVDPGPIHPITTLRSLFRTLQQEIKTFLKQEAQLAKLEMSEKLSRMGRDTIWIVVGATLGLVGLIVFVFGCSFLLTYGLAALGIPVGVAEFLGPIIVGLICCIIGGAMAIKGLDKLSKQSLAPERTIHSLNQTRNGQAQDKLATVEKSLAELPERKVTPKEMETQIDATRVMLQETMDQLRSRFTIQFWKRVLATQVRLHPVASSVIGASSASFAVWWLKHKVFRNPRRN